MSFPLPPPRVAHSSHFCCTSGGLGEGPSWSFLFALPNHLARFVVGLYAEIAPHLLTVRSWPCSSLCLLCWELALPVWLSLSLSPSQAPGSIPQLLGPSLEQSERFCACTQQGGEVLLHPWGTQCSFPALLLLNQTRSPALCRGRLPRFPSGCLSIFVIF